MVVGGGYGERRGKAEREDPEIFVRPMEHQSRTKKLADCSLGKFSGEESESGGYHQDYFATARCFPTLTSRQQFSFALDNPWSD